MTRSVGAQSLALDGDGPQWKVWLGGGVGSPFSLAGLVTQWEAGVARGMVSVSYEESWNDDFNGDARHQRGLLGGVNVPWRRGSILLAGGVSEAKKCVSQGEQSGLRACSHDASNPVLKARVDLAFEPVLGVYVSTLQPLRREVGFATYVVGLEIGWLQ